MGAYHINRAQRQRRALDHNRSEYYEYDRLYIVMHHRNKETTPYHWRTRNQYAREGGLMVPAGKEAADALRRSPLEALR